MTPVLSPTSQNQSALFPFALVEKRLEAVDREIRSQADIFEPEVRGYLNHVCGAGGKRIRPALVLLAGDALGGARAEHERLGVILELVHMASLVHDDIIDGAETRRSTPTANKKWGNALSVLLGDALFAHAMTEATQFDDIEICRVIGRASRDVCVGEIMQTQRRYDFNLSIKDYFRMIEMKTAVLFAVAGSLAARLSGADPETCEALHDYGTKLGTAYQIYDDCIDLVGKESAIGKTLGTDLKKGKLTLPVLNLIRSATPEQRAKLNRLFLGGADINQDVLAGIADYSGALQEAVATGRELAAGAAKRLEALPEGDARDALLGVAAYLDSLLEGCVRG